MAAVNGAKSEPPFAISWHDTLPPPADPPHIYRNVSQGSQQSGDDYRCCPGRSFCGRTTDSHSTWITAKGSNVSLDPIEGSSLIEQTGIQSSIFCNIVSAHKTKHSQTVLNTDEENITIRPIDKSVTRVGKWCATTDVTSSMDSVKYALLVRICKSGNGKMPGYQ